MTRKNRLRVAAVLVGAAVVAGITVAAVDHGGSGGHTASTRTSSLDPPSRTRSTASRSSSRPSKASSAASLPVGITFGGALTNRSSAYVATALDDVVALHMSWIRVDFSWASLQPDSRSSFDWGATDGIVSAARARGLRVLALITYTPAWARARGCASFVCPPARDQDFAAFAAAVVRRYAGQGLTTYQIWNEPNTTTFWSGPNPRAYGALLRVAVPAMRRAHAGLEILFGGLAQASTSQGNFEPGVFLVQACPHGCPIDAVAFDPYTYPDLPSSTDRPFNAWQLMTNPGAAHIGIQAALPAGVKIWVTQFGAPTTYPGADSSQVISESRQAVMISEGLRLARRSAIVGGYFVNTWRDTSTGGLPRDHFGIEHVDGTHKPAFAAIQNALAP